MTEPFHPDDELVNAVLDGEATEAERARVLGDPELRARLEQLTRVRDLVATPVRPPDDPARDEAIRLAIAAGRRDQRVVALRPRRSGLPSWLAAAAVIVVLLAGGVLLANVDDDRDDTASSLDAAGGDESGPESGGEAEESADDAAAAEAAPPTDSTAAADAFAADLGEVTDDDGLRLALERELGSDLNEFDDTPSTPTTTLATQDEGPTDASSPGTARACRERADAAGGPGPRRLFRATYADVPAVVYVFGEAGRGVRVVVVSADDCTVLSSFTP